MGERGGGGRDAGIQGRELRPTRTESSRLKLFGSKTKRRRFTELDESLRKQRRQLWSNCRPEGSSEVTTFDRGPGTPLTRTVWLHFGERILASLWRARFDISSPLHTGSRPRHLDILAARAVQVSALHKCCRVHFLHTHRRRCAQGGRRFGKMKRNSAGALTDRRVPGSVIRRSTIITWGSLRVGGRK